MGALFDTATSFWTLRASARLAARGCRGSSDAARFLAELEVGVLRLQREIRSGCYAPVPLRRFMMRLGPIRRILSTHGRRGSQRGA